MTIEIGLSGERYERRVARVDAGRANGQPKITVIIANAVLRAVRAWIGVTHEVRTIVDVAVDTWRQPPKNVAIRYVMIGVPVPSSYISSGVLFQRMLPVTAGLLFRLYIAPPLYTAELAVKLQLVTVELPLP
jgi:hypothetical protein